MPRPDLTGAKTLVTGGAGFIGSHLVDALLDAGAEVRVMDSLATGSLENLAHCRARIEWAEADLRDLDSCRSACEGVQLAFHQAALGSVPRSMSDPATSIDVNLGGTANLFAAARDQGVERVVYASSSSVYGDHPGLPKVESEIGNPLSPYAATKRIDELWAETCFRSYDLPVVGLRYFNVFGARQDPEGPYAAVIPRWIDALCDGRPPHIFGDGKTSRDFCPVGNIVQANVLAALAPREAVGRSFNVALGCQTSLTELFERLRAGLTALGLDCGDVEAIYEDFRSGDVRHSLADLSAAQRLLGYEPELDFASGIRVTLEWSVDRLRAHS